MKTLALIIFTFFLSNALTIENAFSNSKKDQASKEEIDQLVKNCIKNADKEATKNFNIEKVCDCSVKKTIEFLSDKNLKEKDFQKKLSWLKKMYALALTKKEIEEDTYSIFEFNSSFTESCISNFSKK